MRYSHVAIEIEGWIWDQPIKGTGLCFDRDTYLASKLEGVSREYTEIALWVADHDPQALYEVCRFIEDRAGQPKRTVLRHLRLWPRRAWNCLAPVRLILAAIGLPTDGETPDAIIRALEARELAPDLPHAAGEDDGVG
jgi:hypothetical protein